MKPVTFLLCVLAAVSGGVGNWWPHRVDAFVASSASAAKRNAAPISGLMAAYPDAAAAFMNLNAVAPTGSISFQPHDSSSSSASSAEMANERVAVYDPGDDLLRTLNAELLVNDQEFGALPEEPDFADTLDNELEVVNKYDMLRKLEHDLRMEQEIVSKSAFLMKLLEDPTIETLPVIYVEENPVEDEADNLLYPAARGMSKRSRYYRRYPWKRHNRNRSYDPDLRYACTPTKEDVFKLLVNLHENRKGNHSKTVNFCNRKRPAKAIFTNIRFLG